MRMRTLKLTIAYDGTRYAGWQVQKNSNQQSALSNKRKPVPTIQGTLERVLGQMLQERVRVIGSGRTDAGVHALAQVAHARTRHPIAIDRLQRSANQLLPADIVVMRIEDGPPTFHARFSATSKHYRYRIFVRAAASPFVRPYVHQVHARLDLSAMRREVAVLRGRHDFRAFARARQRRGSSIRTITSVQLKRVVDELHLDVHGNGFLHTMVRSIAGTLMDVGRGRLPSGTIRRMLHTGERSLAGTTAPAQGLTLMHVSYAKKRSVG